MTTQETLKRYALNHKEQIRESSRRYRLNHPERARASVDKYTKSHEQLLKIARHKYIKTHKIEINEHDKKYRTQDIPRRKKIIRNCIRIRSMGWNPLNEWFEGSNGHHIDALNVIYIPVELHKPIKHNHKIESTMTKINIIAWDYLESHAY